MKLDLENLKRSKNVTTITKHTKSTMTDRKRPPTYDDDDDNGPIGIGGLNTNKPKKKVKFGDDNQGSKGVYKKTLSRYNKEQDDIAGNYEEGDDDIDLDGMLLLYIKISCSTFITHSNSNSKT